MKTDSAIPQLRAPLPNQRTGSGAGLIFIISLLVFVPACSERKIQAVNEPAAVPVMVSTVVEKPLPIEVRAIGTVEAYSTVSVKSQVEGVVEHVRFTEGQDVNKGDLLFNIDKRPFEAALMQAEANLARDIALETNAKAQAERFTKLYEAGIVSKDQFDQFKTNAESYDAAVRADKAAVEKAKIDLSYCAISSPLDGRTGSLMLHEGNVVKADADTAMVVIHQVSPIYVDFSVPEQYLAEIKRYTARGKLAVEAVIPNQEQPPAEGFLSFVDNSVDATTGTIKLKGIFRNPDRRLWPGQFVNAVLRLSVQQNVRIVPSEAIQTGQSGQYVFVIKPDLTAELRPVTTGISSGNEIAVEKGLNAGETVVTDGQLRLSPGVKVQIKNPARNSTAGASSSGG